jgi:UDP-2,3-diacylglucosamine pyrophosphatase LpxH
MQNNFVNIITPTHSELIIPARSESQRTLIIGDTHLNGFNGNDHSRHLAEHLNRNCLPRIENSPKDQEELIILNGDFYDFSETFIWQHEKVPYGHNDEANNLETFNLIRDSNREVTNELNNILQSNPNTKLVFVFGNHDHLMLVDNKLREEFQQQFLPDATTEERNQRILFTKSLRLPLLKTQIEHGHRIDKFDYSEANEANMGDYLSYVKMMVIKNIVKRLNDITDTKIPYNIAQKMITEVMKVDFIRDAKAFPLYLKKLAEKYHNKYKESVSKDVADEIYKAVMKYREDFINYSKQTPLLGLIKYLPNKLLNNNLFEEIFLLRFQFIYEQQTHKNSLPLQDAKKMYHEDPKYLNYIRGHTHQFGVEEHRPISSMDEHAPAILLLNNGTWIPYRKASRRGPLSGQINFKKTVQSSPFIEITGSSETGKISIANGNLDTRFSKI